MNGMPVVVEADVNVAHVIRTMSILSCGGGESTYSWGLEEALPHQEADASSDDRDIT